MPWRIYDSCADLTNVVVQPEIRARFVRIEPGPAGRPHSHDLGGEVFLVLAGQAAFWVEGERVVVGPGQLLYVPPEVKHTVEVVGPEPCLLYLSVTPHIEPTHTLYGPDDQPLPPRYGLWRQAGQAEGGPPRSASEALAHHRQAVRQLLIAVQAYMAALAEQAGPLDRAVETTDTAALKTSLDTLWPALRTLLRTLRVLEETWNTLALATAPPAP
jgi:quercetin dioxygenase-like cupin family protein